MSVKPTVAYVNNPFMIGIEGLKLVFTHAQSVGIYSIVLTGILMLGGMIIGLASSILDAAESDDRTQSISFAGSIDPVILSLLAAATIIGTLIYLIGSLLLFGVLDYTAAKTAQGKNTTLKEGFMAVLRNFPAYAWVYIILFTKVFLWSLLFIVPGIIMLNRYLLAGTVFFAEGKRGNAAIRRSTELTHGAWLTTYGGAWSWNLISQGIAGIVFWPGTAAVLYRQFASLTDKKSPKPPAHVISWLVLLVPIGLFILMCLLAIVIGIILALASTAP